MPWLRDILFWYPSRLQLGGASLINFYGRLLVIFFLLFHYDSPGILILLLLWHLFLLLRSRLDILLQPLICLAGSGRDDLITGQYDSVVENVQADVPEDVVFTLYGKQRSQK